MTFAKPKIFFALLLILINCTAIAQISLVEKFRELHRKRTEGLITDEEFEEQRKKITETSINHSKAVEDNSNITSRQTINLGDSKKIVLKILGEPFYDGGYYWVSA